METRYITVVLHHDKALVIQPDPEPQPDPTPRRRIRLTFWDTIFGTAALLLAFYAIVVCALAIPAW